MTQNDHLVIRVRPKVIQFCRSGSFIAVSMGPQGQYCSSVEPEPLLWLLTLVNLASIEEHSHAPFYMNGETHACSLSAQFVRNVLFENNDSKTLIGSMIGSMRTLSIQLFFTLLMITTQITKIVFLPWSKFMIATNVKDMRALVSRVESVIRCSLLL